jgi:uncharacterized protein YndB with AHSA1/START domain
MARGLIAEAATTIDAPREKVWDALVNPLVIKQYMFGTEVESAWEVGSPIVWKGEWQGKPYEDKGVILQLETARRIQYVVWASRRAGELPHGDRRAVRRRRADAGGAVAGQQQQRRGARTVADELEADARRVEAPFGGRRRCWLRRLRTRPETALARVAVRLSLRPSSKIPARWPIVPSTD